MSSAVWPRMALLDVVAKGSHDFKCRCRAPDHPSRPRALPARRLAVRLMSCGWMVGSCGA